MPWLLCCCAIVLLGQAVFGSVATQDLWLITAVGGGGTQSKALWRGTALSWPAFLFSMSTHTHYVF